MSWTDDKVAELTKLWDSGYSASVIGRMLGMSKNAVVGKAHRLRLASRPSPIRRERRTPTRRRVPLLTKPTELRPTPAPPPPEPRYVVRKDGKAAACLWPIGEPGDADFHFCGSAAVDGKPYCPEHCARAYITRTRGEEEAA